MSKSGQRCTGPGELPGEDCGLEVEQGGLCYGHRKQQVRREQLRPLRRYDTPKVRLQAAALALADAESDEAYEKAMDRLEKAAETYARRRRRRAQDVVPARAEAGSRGQTAQR